MNYDNNEEQANEDFLNGVSKTEITTTEAPVEPVNEGIEFKEKKNHKFLFGILAGFVLGAVVCFAVIFGISKFVLNSSNSANTVEEAVGATSSDSKLSYLINIIETYYYQDVDSQTLVDGIYKGLFESLGDPYSAYYTKEEYDDLMTTLTGDYAGIGALLSKSAETGEVAITKVYADTPAEKAGLLEGDVLVAADEYLAEDLDLDEFVSHIRGEAGTDVVLTILRDGEEMKITATRDNISTPTVEYQMLDNNVGYIEVSQFANNTYDDFVAAYEDLEKQGMTSVIFDMRGNGGGLLTSVVDILDYLLPKGTVVYTMDKNGNREDYTSDAENYKSIPMTVLVNENTASAAEIFTGAIRDFDYGTIIGTTTFGKGIVQSTIPLSDGTAVKITTETYYTPSGECIHGVGIEPDIELEYEFLGTEDDEYSTDLDNQIQKAIEVLTTSENQ